MGDLRLVQFNGISVIPERWAGDNERLYAMEPRSRLKRSRDSNSRGCDVINFNKDRDEIISISSVFRKQKKYFFWFCKWFTN